MLEQGRISGVQYSMILILIVTGTTILFTPGMTIDLGGRDALLSPFTGGLEGLIVLLTMVALNKHFPNQTPIEYVKSLFGKWIGSVIAVYLICLLLMHFGIMIREFSDFTTTVTLTRTPPEIIILLMLVVIYYGARQGLEVLARITQMVIIIELIQLLISVVVLATKDVDLSHFTPLFEHGPLPLLRSSLFTFDWAGELILAGFLLPYLRIKKKRNTFSVYGLASITLLLFVSDFFTLGVFGDVIASRLQYGLYEVARYISVANFLERLDPIVMGVWIMLIYCKLAIFCYMISLSIAQLFRLQDYRSLIGVVCLVGAVLSQQMFKNQAEMTSFIVNVEPPYSIAVELVAPLLLLVYAMIRKRLQSQRA